MKTQNIRKNASNKIAAILSQSTKIIFNRYYLDHVSDCWIYAPAVSKSIEQVKDFIKEHYGDIKINLTSDEDGKPQTLVVDAFRGYFVVTFEEVQEEVEEQEADEVEQSVSIKEFSDFEKSLEEFKIQEENKEVTSSLNEEMLADEQTEKVMANLNVDLTSLMSSECSCDESSDDSCDNDSVSQSVSESSKPRVTYKQVKESLELGYISPLTRDCKVTDISEIKVLMSEAKTINLRAGEWLSLATYNKLAALHAMCTKYPGEFDKVIVNIKTKGGQVVKFTHMLNSESFSIVKAWQYNLERAYDSEHQIH